MGIFSKICSFLNSSRFNDEVLHEIKDVCQKNKVEIFNIGLINMHTYFIVPAISPNKMVYDNTAHGYSFDVVSKEFKKHDIYDAGRIGARMVWIDTNKLQEMLSKR